MIDFKVVSDDGDEYEVTAVTRDILLWEKTTKGANFGSFGEAASLSLTNLYKIAYLASKRTGKFSGTQKEFEDAHDIEFDGAEEEDPTQPVP